MEPVGTQEKLELTDRQLTRIRHLTKHAFLWPLYWYKQCVLPHAHKTLAGLKCSAALYQLRSIVGMGIMHCFNTRIYIFILKKSHLIAGSDVWWQNSFCTWFRPVDPLTISSLKRDLLAFIFEQSDAIITNESTCPRSEIIEFFFHCGTLIFCSCTCMAELQYDAYKSGKLNPKLNVILYIHIYLLFVSYRSFPKVTPNTWPLLLYIHVWLFLPQACFNLIIRHPLFILSYPPSLYHCFAILWEKERERRGQEERTMGPLQLWAACVTAELLPGVGL